MRNHPAAGISTEWQQTHEEIIENNQEEKRKQIWDALPHSIAEDKGDGFKDRPHRRKRQHDDTDDKNRLIHGIDTLSLAPR